MAIIDIDAAAADLSRLIDRACEGEEIVIARDGESLVRLVPVLSEAPRRQRGSLQGQVIMSDSFFDPLPDDEVGSWEE